MKRLILILSLLALLLVGCTNQTSSKQNDDSNNISTVSSDTSKEKSDVLESKEIALTEIKNVTESPKKTVQITGVEMCVPEGFIDENIYGRVIYTKETPSGKVHLNYISYIDSELQVDDLTTFLNDLFYFEFFELYSKASGTTFKLLKDNEEDCEVLNSLSKKVSGTIHYAEGEADLHYIAYYSLISLKMYGEIKIPMCWIAFGDDNSDNIEEMENALDVFVGEIKEY